MGIKGIRRNGGAAAIARAVYDEAAPTAFIIIGDSRAGYEANTSGTTFQLLNYGLADATNRYLKRRFTIKQASDLGVSGNTTAQIAARTSEIDTAIASFPGHNIILAYIGATNDIAGGIAQATTITNRRTVWDYITKTLRLPLVIFGEWQRSDFDATMIGKMNAVNADAVAYVAGNSLAWHVDSYTILSDGAGGVVNPIYVESTTVHLNAAGADKLGFDAARQIRHAFGEGRLTPPGWKNLLWNGELKGSGGTNSTTNIDTFTGSVPDNVTLTSSFTALATTTVSLTQLAEGIRVDITSTGGGTSETFRLDIEVTNSFYAQGDELFAAADIQVLEATRADCAPQIRVLDDATADANWYGTTKTNSTDSGYIPVPLRRQRIATEPFVPAAGSVDMTVRLEFLLDSANAPASCSTIIYGVALNKRTPAAQLSEVRAVTSAKTLTVAESGRLLTNEGATASVAFTLPSAQVGLRYGFYVQDSDGLSVVAGSGDTIRLEGSVTAAAGNVSSTTVGSHIWLNAINATEWVGTSIVGTWA